MYKILLVLSLILTGCNHPNDELKDTWELPCYYSEGNVLSDFRGVYTFSGDWFRAEFKSCLNDGLDTNLLEIEYPYTTGDYVTLGSGIDALEINLHINENDTIPALIYIQDNELFWNWGLDATSVKYSIFGMYHLNNEAVWGGFPLFQKDDIFYPITEDFLELEKPTSINFDQYLQRI